MRSVLVLPIALSFVFGTVAAQDNLPTPSRWTLSTGPEWSRGIPALRTWGLRTRAEYDLTKPSSVLGLRLEGSSRWSPTQSYFYDNGFSSYSGTEQRFDLMLGLSGFVSPMPRARISPYVTMGVFAFQEWMHGLHAYHTNGSNWSNSPIHTDSRGDFAASLGLGLRTRIGGRTFQLEYRWIESQTGLTFGTRLPF